MILDIWRQVTEEGQRHGVNPVVFGVLYVIHHPLFWGTVAWIVVRVRQRLLIWPHSLLAAAFWLMPYAYIVLSARQMPWWVIAGIVAIAVVGGYRAYKEFRDRIGRVQESREDPLAPDNGGTG
jgi:hypothetical protein